MTDRALSRADITMLLDELAERLQERRTFAKLHVVGGACLALAYERDRTTEDIDVRVDTGHEALEDAIRQIAQAHDLPGEWLNDDAQVFIPEVEDDRSPTLYESPSLVVTGASAEYLLAMKLEASRQRDENDIRHLLEHLGISDADTALEQHRTLFPDSPSTTKARSLLAMMAKHDERLTPPTPIEELRRRWQLAMTDRGFPHYEHEPTPKGFRLTVTETLDGPTEILGESGSLRTLVRWERTHRGWPDEATDIITKHTERAIAQHKSEPAQGQRKDTETNRASNRWATFRPATKARAATPRGTGRRKPDGQRDE